MIFWVSLPKKISLLIYKQEMRSRMCRDELIVLSFALIIFLTCRILLLFSSNLLSYFTWSNGLSSLSINLQKDKYDNRFGSSFWKSRTTHKDSILESPHFPYSLQALFKFITQILFGKSILKLHLIGQNSSHRTCLVRFIFFM